jgi:citrate lyase subunit beta/citryl-CoA lyase
VAGAVTLAGHPLRSVLFAPGDRPDLLAKLAASDADAVVADWEDGVAVTGKEAARTVTAEAVAHLRFAPLLFVRVNAIASTWFAEDVAALPPGIAGVVVPKIGSAADVAAVRVALADHGRDDVALMVGIETVAGVLDARTTLAAGVDAAYFGAEDYVADLGGVRSETNAEVLYARSYVAMAARVAGVVAIDQIVAAFKDVERFEREALEARGLGYLGKLCIHPGQVAAAHRAFTPSADEVARAGGVVAAVEAAAARGEGVAVVDGVMVDEPLMRQARSVLAAASTSEAEPPVG